MKSFVAKFVLKGFRSRRLNGRLSGISQRSRVIVSGTTRRARRQQEVVLNPVREVRGRGMSRVGQLVSDGIAGPVAVQGHTFKPVFSRQQVVRAVPRLMRTPAVQQRGRQVVLERRGMIRPPFVLQQPRYRSVMLEEPEEVYLPQIRQPTRKRVSTQRPRVIIVNNPSRHQQVMERVVERPLGRMRYVTVNRNSNNDYVNRNMQLREAFGINRARREEPQRFEPSSSFLQRVPSVRQKGRGFGKVQYTY